MSGSAAAALVEFRKLDFSSVRGNKMKKRSESAQRQRMREVAAVVLAVEGGGNGDRVARYYRYYHFQYIFICLPPLRRREMEFITSPR